MSRVTRLILLASNPAHRPKLSFNDAGLTKRICHFHLLLASGFFFLSFFKERGSAICYKKVSLIEEEVFSIVIERMTLR